MKLKSIHKEIHKNFEKWQNYDFYVIKFDTKLDDVTDDSVPELFSVHDIDVEEEEKEVTFLTNELSNDGEIETIKVYDIFPEIEKLMSKCAEYEAFSGSSVIELADGYSGRIDVPIISVGWNESEKQIVLIQEYSEHTNTEKGITNKDRS